LNNWRVNKIHYYSSNEWKNNKYIRSCKV